MDKILICIDTHHGSLEALLRGFLLAERTGAHLFVLVVSNDGGVGSYEVAEEGIKERLALMLEDAEAKGITVDFYVGKGCFEEVVTCFVEEQGITHLILEQLEESLKEGTRYYRAYKNIRHRVACRVEIVQRRESLLKGEG